MLLGWLAFDTLFVQHHTAGWRWRESRYVKKNLIFFYASERIKRIYLNGKHVKLSFEEIYCERCEKGLVNG
jgi:hypothetical protein